MKLLDRLQLKSKLLFLGVVPAAALAIILAVYFTSTCLNDMYDLLHKTNQNLVTSIAESSVNAVYSGNVEELNNILSAAITESNIRSIKITNPVGTTLAKATNTNVTKPDLSKNITQTIDLKALPQLEEFGGILVGQPQQIEELIGYVSLTLSYDSMKQREQAILLNSILITLPVLFLIGLIAKYISTVISRPILQLTTDVKNISQGNYTPTSNSYNNDEIAILSTGIHNMALEINSHQNELQRKIHDATKELRLQNEKLFEAQEKIIKATQAKSRFISHISHEIRTPLNGIIGFLEIMHQTSLDDEQKKLINASLLASKNLHTIINDVLDYARLSAGKAIINRTDFHIRQTVQDALLLLSTQAQSNNVTLSYSQSADAPDFIHQDAVKFGQILINLIGNAIKFSPKSSVSISITTNTPKRDQLKVSISDQGKGISDENIKLLFKEFSQFGHIDSIEGTGLGLTITKHILDIIGGKISVESVLGKGSTFTFTFPFQTASTNNSALTKTASADRTLPDLSGVNILVADDNEINRLLLTNLLKRQGAHIFCVNDGQEAINKANIQKFDLMLLDLRMPIKMGNEALFEIRNQTLNPNYKTPAIAITAHITSGEERTHHISSFDGYLIKPIDQVRFFSLVEYLLNGHDHESPPFFLSEKIHFPDISNKHFDYNLAKNSMNADPSFVSIILTKFFTELPQQHTHIAHNIEEEQLIHAAEIVHKVHGSAAYCGASLLKLTSKQLEVILRENDTENLVSAHEKFISSIDELMNLKSKILAAIK